MTWMPDETLVAKGLTLSKTFDENVDTKYTLGTIYSPFVVFIELQVSDSDVEDLVPEEQLYTLEYYLGIFLPAHVSYSITLIEV